MNYKFAIIACLLLVFGSFNVMAGMMFQNIVPQGDCVLRITDDICRAIFGYNNPNNQSFTVPVGVNNYVLVPGSANANWGQPENFDPGVHTGVFFIDWDCQGTIVWNLETWGDEYAYVSVDNTPACRTEPVCGNGIVEPPEECEQGN